MKKIYEKLAYCKKHNSKAVKKTLSIPEWLNEEAIKMGGEFFPSTLRSVDVKITSEMIMKSIFIHI